MTEWKEEGFQKISDWQLAFIVTMFVLLAIAMITLPAHAMTITMSNPGGLTERDIIVYYPNDTMQGFYNSTSVITLDANSSYIFAMKPLTANPLEDPLDWLNSTFAYLTTNVTALLIFCFGAGVVYMYSRP